MIPIQNVYYMLAYAFRALRMKEYKTLGTEPFRTTGELCAAILILAVFNQAKKGFFKEYVTVFDENSCIHGKIDINESIRQRSMIKHKVVCQYDRFSIDTYMNRIIKSTILFLLRLNISKKRKKQLHLCLAYFADVRDIPIQQIQWNFQYHQQNQTYQLLMNICELILNGLIPNYQEKTIKLADFLDDQHMSKLYEKFILMYYKEEYPQLHARPAQIPWATASTHTYLLPLMQSDVTLTYQHKTLIIDAKYYSKMMQQQYGKRTFHSNNLYQIFTYVKNWTSVYGDTNVAGLLLYAKTDEPIVFSPEPVWLGDNALFVKSLDLNCSFEGISTQLNQIVEMYFNIHKT